MVAACEEALEASEGLHPALVFGFFALEATVRSETFQAKLKPVFVGFGHLVGGCGCVQPPRSSESPLEGPAGQDGR